MAVYFIGDAAGLWDLWIAVLEVALAMVLVAFVFTRQGHDDRRRCCARATSC